MVIFHANFRIVYTNIQFVNRQVLFYLILHLCTCLEIITKGIICQHFWRIMLYSSLAQFHIRIIPIRWYNNNVLTNLNVNLENSPILTAVKPLTLTLLPQVNFTFQSLQQLQESNYNNVIINKNTSQRNRFGIAFSTAKIAVNITLETNSELIKLLKEFIAAKRDGDSNSNDDEIEINDANNIVLLQQHLINKITNPNVTRIHDMPSKRLVTFSSSVTFKGQPC
jgi:hypothetical protein